MIREEGKPPGTRTDDTDDSPPTTGSAGEGNDKPPLEDSNVGSECTADSRLLPDGGLRSVASALDVEDLKRCAIVNFYEGSNLDKVARKGSAGPGDNATHDSLPCCIVIQSPNIMSLLSEVAGTKLTMPRYALVYPVSIVVYIPTNQTTNEFSFLPPFKVNMHLRFISRLLLT